MFNSIPGAIRNLAVIGKQDQQSDSEFTKVSKQINCVNMKTKINANKNFKMESVMLETATWYTQKFAEICLTIATLVE